MDEITNAAPQIVNLMEKGGITPDQAEKVAQDLVGEYGWFALAALIAILAKDVMMNFAQAIMVFAGPVPPAPLEVRVVSEEKSPPRKR